MSVHFTLKDKYKVHISLYSTYTIYNIQLQIEINDDNYMEQKIR